MKRISTERAERLVSRGGRTASGAARVKQGKVVITCTCTCEVMYMYVHDHIGPNLIVHIYTILAERKRILRQKKSERDKREREREVKRENILPASGVVKLTVGPVAAPALFTATAR